jgi:quinoprotein glucose dehydrogenase
MKLVTFFFAVFFAFNTLNAENNIDWIRSGGGDHSLKYTDLDQINKDNIGELEIAWTSNIGNKIPVQTNPVLINQTLVTTNEDKLIGINPSNGKIKWKIRLPKPVAKRGFTGDNGLLYVPTSEGVFVVSAETGEFVTTNNHKFKYGKSFSVLPPVVTAKKVYVANLVGGIEAFDKVNASSLWKLNLIKDGVSPRLWSGLSYDNNNKILYVVTSNANGLIDQDIKDGGYSSSLIAINALDGAIIWQFQDVRHDLWDLDVVGAPIIYDIKKGGHSVPTVMATTKSGNVIYLNRLTGKPIYDAVTKLSIPRYKNSIKFNSEEQIVIDKPERISSIYFDTNKDITNLSVEKFNYVSHKLRNAKNQIFRPVDFGEDVVLFGLHGGAEWPGASFNPNNKLLIIPSNKYPWVLRKSYYDKHEEYTINKVKKNNLYKKKCASCHAFNLKGYSAGEKHGDTYFPPLIGITKIKPSAYLDDIESFYKNHKYVGLIDEQLRKKTNNIWRAFIKINAPLTTKAFNLIKFKFPIIFNHDFKNTIDSVTQEDLKSLKRFFIDVDQDIMRRNDYGISANWQLLLDEEGLPGSKPPWGQLTAIDMSTGFIKWQKPFGLTYSETINSTIKGDMNFGGVLTTRSNLIFANGTRDSKVRAFNINTGENLWSAQLPAAGSTFPSSFLVNGCQYIIITATGGKFFGFTKKSDSIIAFKLRDCNPTDN